MVRPDEIVGAEHASPHQKRREEDKIEGQEGEKAEAFQRKKLPAPDQARAQS
jgi:hypothetical protein